MRCRQARGSVRSVRARRGAIAAGCGLVLLAGLAPPARAQDASDLARARESFKHALADEQAGQFEKAAAEFNEARTLAQKETPQVLFHLGVCHSRLGRVVLARDELSSAVTRATTEGLDKVAATAKAELEQVKPRIAAVTVKAPPAHGVVKSMTLDRVEVTAKVGTAIEVDPGPHDVHAELSDGPPADVHVNVAEGERKEVVLTGGSAPAPAPAPTPTPAPAPAPAPESAPESAPVSSGSKTLGWVLVGGGAAAVAGGVVFWVLRGNEGSTLNGECGAGGRSCPKSAQSDIDAGKLDDALGVTLFIAGGAAALAGAGLFVFGGHGSPSTAMRVTPYLTAHGAGIGVTGATW